MPENIYQNAIEVVEATDKHVFLLRDLSERTFREAYAEDTDPTHMEIHVARSFQTEHVTSDFQNPQVKFLLLKYGEQWAAYALLRWDRTHELLQSTRALQVHRIYVLRDFWRHRLGSVLMQYIVDFAMQQGYEWLWLAAWEENKRALAFYEKWGFEHFGYETFQFGEELHDDWALRKKL